LRQVSYKHIYRPAKILDKNIAIKYNSLDTFYEKTTEHID